MSLACIIGAWVFHIGAVPALGHAILISRGKVVVHPDRVSAAIEVGAEDFFHYYHFRIDKNSVATDDVRQAVERHRTHLLERFSIRDGEGDRLTGRISDVRFEVPNSERIDFLELRKILVTYTIDYPTQRTLRFLTFQQRFGDDSTVVPSQLVVSVRLADRESGRLVVLTSGGNFETVDLQQSAIIRTLHSDQPSKTGGALDPEHSMGADRFKEVFAFVKRDEVGCFVDMYVPLVLMETFTPVSRSNADYIEPPEISAQCAALRTYFANKPPLAFFAGSDVKELPPVIDRIAFLAPTECRLEDAPSKPRRLGAWSARISVRVRCPARYPTAVDWRFLNASVMNATIRQVVNGRPGREEPVFKGDTRVTLHAAGRR